MATFFWVPNRDTAYQGEFFRLATAGGQTGSAMTGNAAYNCKFLPPDDCRTGQYAYACHPKYGTSNTPGMTAAWSNVGDFDELYIGAHGGARDSSQVAWKSDQGEVTWWNASQLSVAIRANFLPQEPPTLHYHLYACFGANSYYKTGECFGTRLRREMMVNGFRGKLTAYNGAVGLNTSGGHQTGSSRITCALWYGIGQKHHNSGDTSKMGKTWDLLPAPTRARR